MSILDNEGHDPNGLGNRPTRVEVEELRAENERLATMVESLRLSAHAEKRGRQEAEAEIERLQNTITIDLHALRQKDAEIGRLRAALTEIVRLDEMHGSAGSAIWLAGDVARRALEQNTREEKK